MKTISTKQTVVKVATGVKAGGFSANHNRRSLTVKSGVKAGEGILAGNNSRRLA